ncbi:histidinol dehydrogenase [Phytohabitans sp. LJ34]|uniref:histidinol dehydrogenase n=1 Tax=Phytohabitans sp. LJ34 TaxID=3452217 RepID=UPI003F89BC9A
MTEGFAVEINRYDLTKLSPEDRLRLLRRAQTNVEAAQEDARRIIEDVRHRGDDALVEYAQQFDGARLSPTALAVTEDEFTRAEEELSPILLETMRQAVTNVRRHHQAQLPQPTWMIEPTPGVITGERITPIESVGLYVPRGKGSFPSVMMMLSVPAVLAGVQTIVICTPPGPDGTVDSASLVMAKLCGVSTVLKVGGAQAVAALAYGTKTVPRVSKIIGPGNPYVAAAKQLVYGVVDPGLPAGPSESLVLCDDRANPAVAARELIVEAEHGPDSAAVLVTTSQTLADEVATLVGELVQRLPSPRREFCEKVFSGYGGIVVAPDLSDAIDFVNEYAPEHLRVLVEDPFSVLNRIRNAGEVLLGEYASIPYGNFALGVNAILPTGGNARSYSCVSVYDFLKRSSFSYVSPAGARAVGPIAVALADYEGFPAHSEAARFVLDRATEEP